MRLHLSICSKKLSEAVGAETDEAFTGVRASASHGQKAELSS